MDTQLIHDVILKFETSQFQRNNQNRAKSISGPESGKVNNKTEPDFFRKNEDTLRKDYIWPTFFWFLCLYK